MTVNMTLNAQDHHRLFRQTFGEPDWDRPPESARVLWTRDPDPYGSHLRVACSERCPTHPWFDTWVSVAVSSEDGSLVPLGSWCEACQAEYDAGALDT